MAIPERILHDYNPALIANTALYSLAGNTVGSGDAAVLDLSGNQLSVTSGALSLAGGHGYPTDDALLLPTLTNGTIVPHVFSSRQRVRAKYQNNIYILTNCATVGGGGAGLLSYNGQIWLDCRDLGGQMSGSVLFDASVLSTGTFYDFETISDLSADLSTRTITINIFGIDGTTIFSTSATTNFGNLLGNFDLRIASFQGLPITNIAHWQVWDRTFQVSAFPAAPTQEAIIATATITGGSGTYTQQWYRSTTPGFTPGSSTILPGQTLAALNDTTAVAGTTYYYIIVAADNAGRAASSEQFGARLATKPDLKIWFFGNSIPSHSLSTAAQADLEATTLSDLTGKMLQHALGDRNVSVMDNSQGGSRTRDWAPANNPTFWTFYFAGAVTAGCNFAVCEFGGNDCVSSNTGSIGPIGTVEPAEFDSDLRAMAAACADAGIPLFILKPLYRGPNPPGDVIDTSLLLQYAARIDQIADGKTVFTDRGEVYQLTANDPSLLDASRNHPTDAGLVRIASAWAAEIAANLPPVIPDVVAPAGPLSVAIDSLVSLIAAVPFFQAWTNTANASLAEQRIFVGEVGYPIYSAAIAAGVLTIQTREFHEIQVGNVVTIEGAGLGAEANVNLDGQWTVTATTPDTFTAATALPDLAVIYPQFAFVLDCVRPIAVVAEGADGLESENIGTGNPAVYSGSLDILLEADASSQYANSPANALTEARNAVGNFLEGLMETQDTGDLMVLNNAKLTSGPEFVSKAQQDDGSHRFERWRAIIRVTWGVKS